MDITYQFCTNMNLQLKLEAAVQRLTDLNQDKTKEQNDVGWSRIHAEVGASLARQIGSWSPAQVNLAWKICSVYRNTQLANLEIPAYSEAEAKTLVPPAVESLKDILKTLTWNKPKLVKTKNGPKIVTSANVPDKHPFWAVWRTSKEEAKKLGYGVSMFRDQWTVTLWQDVGQTSKPEPQEPVQITEEPLPAINTEGLLPYQVKSVQRMVASIREHGAVLDASDVGTGKTYSALAACRALGLKPLVVCPKAVIPSWQRAAKHFGIEIEAVNYELIRRGGLNYCKPGEGPLRGHTFFTWFLDSIGCTGLIFDEVHRCKAQSSLNSKLLVAAKKQGIPTLALSATAATDPTEMKALGFLLGLFSTPSEHWAWCLRNNCSKGRFGGITFHRSDAALKAIHHSIFPKRGTRIRVADLGDAFPESQISTQLVSLNGNTDKLNEAYRLAEEAVERVREKEATDPTHHLTLMLRARQISEAGKLPLLVDMIEDAIEQNMSVAVFLNFSESIATLVQAIGDKVAHISTIQGGQTAEERQAAIEAFQADKARVIVCNIQAGGVGVSLHDLNGAHPRLSLISPTWSAIDLRQTLGRVHRAGGKTKSLQRLIYAQGTIEEKVADSVQEKLKQLDSLNDGDLSNNLI